MSYRFRGPIWPRVGPDWNEPIERFRPEFLERECRDDPRVQEWLATRPEALAARIARLERELAELRFATQGEKEARAGKPNACPRPRRKASYQGVPV